MKKVLLVDMGPTLRQYVTKKLHEAGIFVLYAHNYKIALEYLQKSELALVIVEHNSSRDRLFDFFEKKSQNPKCNKIPSILLANKINKTEKALLISYNVKNAFASPIMVDSFFSELSKILNIPFELDYTPCLLETRINDNLIVVELAQGLNRTKIDLLYFRLEEIIRIYNIENPKVLVMLTDIELNYTSVSNLEFLIDRIIAVEKIERKNLKFLTLNSFAVEFFKESPHYNNVEVSSSLPDAVSSIVLGNNEQKLRLMECILQASNTEDIKRLSLNTRFKRDIPKSWTLAVVDDDPVICQTVKAIFNNRAEVSTFSRGKEFIQQFSDDKYDLVFLDMIMPEIDGISVMTQLKKAGAKTPFIMLSGVKNKETILNALEKGAKRYVLKPINTEIILRKTKEILGDSF